MYIHSAAYEYCTYVDDHFRDHVGKSFSRMRVYTDRLDRVATASKPIGVESKRAKCEGHTESPDMQLIAVTC